MIHGMKRCNTCEIATEQNEILTSKVNKLSDELENLMKGKTTLERRYDELSHGFLCIIQRLLCKGGDADEQGQINQVKAIQPASTNLPNTGIEAQQAEIQVI